MYGPVAQLGERMTGSHEVVGSIPIGSIRLAPIVARSWRAIRSESNALSDRKESKGKRLSLGWLRSWQATRVRVECPELVEGLVASQASANHGVVCEGWCHAVVSERGEERRRTAIIRGSAVCLSALQQDVYQVFQFAAYQA